MIRENDETCPICNGALRSYGSAKRMVRTKYGKRDVIHIKRYKCMSCGIVHNKLPEFVTPYIRYETDIFIGVLEGLITSNTLGFEDYPSEITMKRWSQKYQFLL